MSADWSTSERSTSEGSECGATSPVITGIDLHLELDAAGGRRAAIERALRQAIRGGRLGAGVSLPSSRLLARDLAVARGTVTEAYDQLVAEGWLAARRGSGTTVVWTGEPARSPGGSGAHRRPPADDPVPRHDFRPGSPDVSAFPRQEWAAAVRRGLRAAPDAILRYGDSRGLPATRGALAGYLARARGVRTDPDRIIVCSGFVQALALLTTTLRRLGTATVAMENPSMTAYRDVAVRAGLAVRSLTVDVDGADPGPLLLTGGADDVGAVFLTPAHQYPTGTTLAPERRSAFTAWARTRGAYLVEDDYDGEFRYDRQPVGALQGIDPDHVVYVGTASKSLAPGLRLGWMVLPGPLIEPVAEAKELADRQTGVIDQLGLSELIKTGGLDRHIRRSRLRYRHRRDELVACLAAIPSVRAEGIAAGLHAVLDLPSDGPTEAEVVRGLADHDVAVHGLAGYWHEPGVRPRGIVVGYGTPPEHAFPAAVRALTDALAEMYGVKGAGAPRAALP